LGQASGVKCGVGYDFQLLENVPAEPHDAKVDFIFTPSRGVRRRRH
jgi:5-formyltetrahydrofolate cyclo-ligase